MKQLHNHSTVNNGKPSPTYNSWQKMKARCYDPHNNMYQYYGARGIKVCAGWHHFENFLAYMGERPLGMTLDRINGDEDYTPNNCRWAASTTQARNKRVQSRNVSGVTGVTYRKDSDKWRAMIRIDGKLLHLGTFESFGDAVAARLLAEEAYYGDA